MHLVHFPDCFLLVPFAVNQIHVLMDLVSAFIPRLDTESLALLYRAVKPQLVDPDAVIQKASYSVWWMPLAWGEGGVW
jgi:hypothetical protein